MATIDAVCARRGLRVRGMRPVGTLLNHALVNPAMGAPIEWIDGLVSLRVTCGEHGVVCVQRQLAQHGDSASKTTVDLHGPLADLGTDAWRYAGAYAAVRAGNAAPLMLARPDDSHRRQHRALRRIASIAALVVGTAVTLAAPGVVAARTRSQNEKALGTLRAAASSAARDRVALDQQQSALRQVRAFAATRRLVTPLLSTLSLQLPESTAIVALRLDTLGGSLVVLSPLGAELVSAVSATPDIDGLQLSAPITREAIGPLEFQRTALRFRFKRTPPATRVQRR